MRHFAFVLLLCTSILQLAGHNKDFFSFTAKTIDGQLFDFSQLKGKKVMIVNTASKCGLTPQYEDLQKLFDTYKKDHFVIIGFPANNFAKQEPGSNSEISSFCSLNYGVTFQMMEKIDVKGKNIHPLYKWLTQKAENGKMDAPVTWNFQKFLIDENGQLIGFAPPKEKPDSKRIIKWIKTGKY